MPRLWVNRSAHTARTSHTSTPQVLYTNLLTFLDHGVAAFPPVPGPAPALAGAREEAGGTEDPLPYRVWIKLERAAVLLASNGKPAPHHIISLLSTFNDVYSPSALVTKRRAPATMLEFSGLADIHYRSSPRRNHHLHHHLTIITTTITQSRFHADH